MSEPALHANSIASLPPNARTQWLDSLDETELTELEYDWRFWARPEQVAPEKAQGGGPWSYWLYLAGRGAGKTRSGAEWVREQIEVHGKKRGAFIAPTRADYRSVMVEGPAGILAISRPDNMPVWEPSKRLLTWPNGAQCEMFSAEEPQRLRGPQHEFIWADELCAWTYLQMTWDMAMFGLRLGDSPQIYISTTPKPSETLRDIMADPHTAITRGGTRANAANLAPQFLKQIVKKYEGTRLGRQELDGEVLEDMPGALWTRGNLDRNRIRDPKDFYKLVTRMKRIVVAVDPSGTDDETGALQGINVSAQLTDDSFVNCGDHSMSDTPDRWGKRVVELFLDPLGLRSRVDPKELHLVPKANLVVAEKNFGGNMVEHVIKSCAKDMGVTVPVKLVNASNGKHVRAEPISSLYEQNRVKHNGVMSALEDQLCLFNHEGYQGGSSPDRADALVWALTELAYPGKQLGWISGVKLR